MREPYEKRITNTFHELQRIIEKIKNNRYSVFMIIKPEVLDNWHLLNKQIDAYFQQKESSNIEDLLFEKRIEVYYLRYSKEFSIIYNNIIESLDGYFEDNYSFSWSPTDSVAIFQEKSGDFIDFYKAHSLIPDQDFVDSFSERSEKVVLDCPDGGLEETEVIYAENKEANKIEYHAMCFTRCLRQIRNIWSVLTSRNVRYQFLNISDQCLLLKIITKNKSSSLNIGLPQMDFLMEKLLTKMEILS